MTGNTSLSKLRPTNGTVRALYISPPTTLLHPLQLSQETNSLDENQAVL